MIWHTELRAMKAVGPGAVGAHCSEANLSHCGPCPARLKCMGFSWGFGQGVGALGCRRAQPLLPQWVSTREEVQHHVCLIAPSTAGRQGPGWSPPPLHLRLVTSLFPISQTLHKPLHEGWAVALVPCSQPSYLGALCAGPRAKSPLPLPHPYIDPMQDTSSKTESAMFSLCFLCTNAGGCPPAVPFAGGAPAPQRNSCSAGANVFPNNSSGLPVKP